MIIGIAGAKHSGKNTVAGFIKDHFDSDLIVKEWSFAADLKISAARALDYKGTDEECIKFCDDLKEKGSILVACDYEMADWKISGREYLQLYGTEAHREIFGTNFWVNNLFQKIFNDEDGTLNQLGDNRMRLDLITDVRFPNEADAVHTAGGKILQIRRDEVENGDDTHASEKPLDKDSVDFIIYNNSDLGHLESEARVAIRYLAKSQLASALKDKVPYA
jgi:hypothetical protein